MRREGNDASISASTDISIQFAATNTEDTRRNGASDAVSKPVTLTPWPCRRRPLDDFSIASSGVAAGSVPVRARVVTGAVFVPDVVPGELTVFANVSTRWEFPALASLDYGQRTPKRESTLPIPEHVLRLDAKTLVGRQRYSDVPPVLGHLAPEKRHRVAVRREWGDAR
jgi:hypothetical protein